jgi:hypothetical protein
VDCLRYYLEEGFGSAPAFLVVLDVVEHVPSILVLGAERQVVAEPGGCTQDHVVDGEGRLVFKRVLF